MTRCFCLWQKRCAFGAMCAYGTLRIKNCHCEERNDVAISRKGHDIKIRFASAGFSRCCNATPQNDINKSRHKKAGLVVF